MYTFFLCFQIFLFNCKSDLWMQNLIGLLIIKDLHFYICLYYFYNWGFISVFVVVFLNILDNYMWLELSFFLSTLLFSLFYFALFSFRVYQKIHVQLTRIHKIIWSERLMTTQQQKTKSTWCWFRRRLIVFKVATRLYNG